ncbi:hypothetical protein BDR07DRAFT_1452651 [Suillus spraguei]|nr:hypothetical protein BDR07DRAFT_1452651 [Suillus spraguei]
MPNQNKQTSPLEEIAPHILRYWKARQTDRKIVENLQNHFDTSHYGLGEYTKFRQICNDMGLLRTRQQSHTIECICEAMIELRKAYPNAGAREMVILLFHEKEMSVSRNLVIAYCAIYEADLVHQRKARRLKRRRFWAAGSTTYSLWINTISGFDWSCIAYWSGAILGRIMWIRVWHSNRNPQLILTYYLETIQKLGHIPRVTQSDPGTENYRIANAHTMLHQMNDLALQGTLQHRWMWTKKNVKLEITWSQLRHWFTPGFETLLDEGVENGWYDSDNTLQCELDRYQDRVNNTLKRPDRNKVLPHGVPNLIYESPEAFGALTLRCTSLLEPCCHTNRLIILGNSQTRRYRLCPPSLCGP